MGQFDRIGFCLLCTALTGSATLSASGQTCEPAWAEDGELPSLTRTENETNDIGRAWAVFDDGAGPDLYSGGLFTHADELVINGLARWDGSAWSDVGGGVTGKDGVYALVVHNDGAGDALYVAGSFTHAGGVPANSVAKWDGYLQLPANLDADGDLDLDDVRRFILCRTGPGGTVELACERGDVNGDADIDLQDFGGVQTGPFQTRRTH